MKTRQPLPACAGTAFNLVISLADPIRCGVIGPEQCARNVGGRQSQETSQLRAQQFRGFLYVFFAVIEDCFLPIFAPTPGADIFRDLFLVDASPTFNAVSATCIREALPRLLPHFIWIVWQQHVAGSKV